MTIDQQDPYGIVLATLRECKLRDHYTDEQRELQPDLADGLREALGDGFEVEISVGPGHPKPRVPLLGTTFWPDLVVSRDGAPIAAVEAKYIRKGESSTSPIAETIGQALIYTLQYPRAVAFILQEGTADGESDPEVRLRELLARCRVDLVLRRR